jgi:hypothetical protein
MSSKLGTILADFTTTLATDTAVGATSATLSSATDDDGVALPAGRYFFTIDGDNSSKEHISCDLSSTAITNIKSLSRQGVETTGVARKHRIGAAVSLTDFGHIKFINDLVSGATSLNSAAPLGYDGAPASLSGNQLATVTYVLGVVNGGAVTFDQQILSNQTSGEVLAVNDVVYFKESDSLWYKVDADLTATFDQLQMGICKTVAATSGITIQVAISGPVSGFSGLTSGAKYYVSNTAGAITTTPGTNSVFVGWALTTAILLFTPFVKTLPTQKEKDAMAGGSTFGTPSSTNKFVTEDYLAGSGLYECGDGSDGDVTISVPTTLTRDMYYNNLVVTDTLTAGNYRIFVKGTLSGAGTITNAGGAGGAGGNGGTGGGGSGSGGTAGASAGSGYFSTQAGKAGGAGAAGAGGGVGTAGTAGTAVTTAIGVAGSAGGAGGASPDAAGGAGAAGGGVTANLQKLGVLAWQTLSGVDLNSTGTPIKYTTSGSSGSAGGGGGGERRRRWRRRRRRWLWCSRRITFDCC